MWKTTMLKECFSNVKKTWDRLCRPDISKQLCTSVSPKQHNNNKDWFLYLNMHNRLCRLSMRDFCENQGSSKYELIHDYYPGFPPNTIPTDMEPVIVGSKVYMRGGKSASNEIFNLNVYSFDPSGDPPFRLCEGPISRLIPPKFHDLIYSDIRVLSIEEKIYVLDLPLIRVFDTVHQSWKDLPHLPCLPDTNFRWFRHFFCGHKIFISLYSCDTAGYDRVHGGSYIFDTREEKWEATSTIRYDVIKWFQSPAIEFKGFLIAVMRYCYKHYEDKVIAYKLDSNGIPNWESYQVLHEISEMASYYCYYYLSKCDGGRIWLVADIGDGSYDSYRNQTHLTVFQVSVSNDIEGNQTLSVKIEAQGAPDFEPSNYCSSAFALCHHAENIESH